MSCFDEWFLGLSDRALDKVRRQQTRLLQETTNEDWFHLAYDQEIREDITADDAYVDLFLSMDLAEMAATYPQYMIWPDLVRHKLMLKHHQGFGGAAPVLHIKALEKTINVRRLPVDVHVNPLAKAQCAYTLSGEDREIYEKAQDLMVMAEFVIDGLKKPRCETIELMLLLATPVYREAAALALQTYMHGLENEITLHFAKNVEQYKHTWTEQQIKRK